MSYQDSGVALGRWGGDSDVAQAYGQWDTAHFVWRQDAHACRRKTYWYVCKNRELRSKIFFRITLFLEPPFVYESTYLFLPGLLFI